MPDLFRFNKATGRTEGISPDSSDRFDFVLPDFTATTGASQILNVPDWLRLGDRVALQYIVGTEAAALTVGTGKLAIRMPFAMTLTDIRASVTTAPVGAAVIVDVNEGGTSILDPKLSIDDGAKTSVGSAAPVTITDPNLADDAEITIDVDQIGSGTAGAGLKVTLIGIRV